MLKYHIQTIEVGSGGSATITFSGIPQTYDDLLLLTSVRTSAGDDNLYVRFNGSTSGYTHRNLLGNGSGAFSQTQSNQQPGVQVHGMIGSTANTFGNGQVYVPNYRSSTSKSVSSEGVGEQNSTTGYQFLVAGLWTGTAAVNTVTLYAQGGGNFVEYSSVSLYGIKRGASGQVNVASGGTVSTSGGYTYHTFTSSGTFVANRNLQIDALVVAGGGAAGYDWAAGGGAGGVQYLSSQSVSAGAYAVAIGAGGVGVIAEAVRGASGSNTSFSGFSTAIGGGGGGGLNYPSISTAGTGGNGGSGGGGNQADSYRAGGLAVAGTGGTFYGNNGGSGERPASAQEASGGGGGAGAVGGNGASLVGGAGGIGTNLFSSWAVATSTGHSGYYAGGGGGAGRNAHGAGGLGGGGNGGTNATGADGLANTGGGGGGDGHSGGSGVVIIRYLTPA
jgi:hypothetical protein